jgi:putative tryptophan/tyrosine transport system substrate-binding protein
VRRLTALVALAAVSAVAGACGDDDNDDGVTVRVAFLRAVSGFASTEPAFLSELRRAGFEAGRNLVVLGADAEEAYPDPADAAAVARRWEGEGVDLIVALSSSGALAAAESAPRTDVLFLSNDPTATGLVADEAAPGGRLTGVSFRVPADRTLSLAQRAVPGLDEIGLAFPPGDPAAVANLDAVALAAEALDITLVTSEFVDGADAPAAVAELAEAGVDALLLSTSPVATRAAPDIAVAAAEHRLPVIANNPVVDFAVVSLSPDTEELGRQLGRQAARLLNGAEPSSVPVEDPNHFLLTLDAGIAAQLGITLSADLLREANSVIG